MGETREKERQKLGGGKNDTHSHTTRTCTLTRNRNKTYNFMPLVMVVGLVDVFVQGSLRIGCSPSKRVPG